MSTDLGRAARRGGIVTLGSQGLRLVVQLMGLSVLGRLLAPHDYGLVAIVTVLVSAGEVFRDFGLSAAAIQAKTLSRGQRDNLFWVNTGIGVLLAVLLCSASPLLAAVYDDDRLVLLAVVMSSVFVLNGVSTQFRAGLARDLSFGRLSGAELTGQVTGVAAAVTAAVLGAGYWALAVQWISAQLVALVLVVAWSRWLPRWVDRTASIRSFLGFGSALLGSTLLNNSVNYVSPLALGLTTSPAAVGIYNRAQQLVTMPMTQIQAPTTRVALPVLSRLQHEPVRYSQMLLRGQLLLLTLLGLVFATLFAQAPAAVRVLLGPQWGATVPLFRLLLIAGFFQAATYAANWVFQSRALTGSQLRYSLATRPAFVILIAVGAFWGPAGTAIAYTVCTAIAWPLSLLWLRRATDVPTGRMFGNGVRTGVLSVAAACASFGATHVLDMPALLDLVVGGLATLATAALAVAAFPSTRREARAALTTARRRLRRGRGAASSATVPPATVPPATEPVTTAPLTTAPEETVKSPRPASRSLRRLQNVAVRTWFSSGVPTALDRRAVRRAHRLAVRSVAPGDRGHHLVLAAPGEGNLGDQALLESLLEGTGLPVLLAVPHGQVPDLPDALRERVELVDAPHLLYGGGASHRASVRAYGAALARSSHVSLIGADVMDGTYSLPASVRRASAVTAAARTGAGTRVIGFSWSPTPRPAAVKELRRAARAGVELLVRDPVSLARLQRDGVGPLTQVADVVFSARTVDASAADALLPEGGSGWAVVNASGLIARRADLLDDYVTVVRGLRSRGLRVLLLPHVLRSGTDDLVACRALRDRLEPGEVEVVEHLLTPAQVRGVARRAEVVVTGRMHLAVMSLMAGVPAITLATQGKVEGLTQLAGEPRLAVAPVAGFAGTVLGLVDEVLAPDSPVRRSVRSSLPALRHLAEQNLAGLEGDLPREPVLVGSQER